MIKKVRTPRSTMIEVAERQDPPLTSNPTLLKPGVGYLRGTTEAEKTLIKDLKSDDLSDVSPLRTQFLHLRI